MELTDYFTVGAVCFTCIGTVVAQAYMLGGKLAHLANAVDNLKESYDHLSSVQEAKHKLLADIDKRTAILEAAHSVQRSA